MPSTIKLQELQYNDIEALNTVSDKFLQDGLAIRKASRLTGLIVKLYREAELKYRTGEHETAYIFYSRLMHMSSFCTKLDKAQQSELKKSLKLEKVDLGAALEKLQSLLSDLKRRYDVKKLIKSAEASELEREQSALNEVFSDFNGSSNDKPSTEQIIEPPADKLFIDCKELYNWLTDSTKSSGMLLIDVREKDEFLNSKIQFSDTINIDPDSCTPGLSASRLGQSMTSLKDKACFQKRHRVDYLVLYDWNTTVLDVTQLDAKNALRHLYSAVYEYDALPLKHRPIFLNGGYREFYQHFPTFCTGSPIRNDNEIIENVHADFKYASVLDYPDIFASKPHVSPQQPSQPALESNTHVAPVAQTPSNATNGAAPKPVYPTLDPTPPLSTFNPITPVHTNDSSDDDDGGVYVNLKLPGGQEEAKARLGIGALSMSENSPKVQPKIDRSTKPGGSISKPPTEYHNENTPSVDLPSVTPHVEISMPKNDEHSKQIDATMEMQKELMQNFAKLKEDLDEKMQLISANKTPTIAAPVGVETPELLTLRKKVADQQKIIEMQKEANRLRREKPVPPVVVSEKRDSFSSTTSEISRPEVQRDQKRNLDKKDPSASFSQTSINNNSDQHPISQQSSQNQPQHIPKSNRTESIESKNTTKSENQYDNTVTPTSNNYSPIKPNDYSLSTISNNTGTSKIYQEPVLPSPNAGKSILKASNTPTDGGADHPPNESTSYPTNQLPSPSPPTARVPLKSSTQGAGGLKRAGSSPNIAKLVDGESINNNSRPKVVTVNVDRNIKPSKSLNLSYSEQFKRLFSELKWGPNFERNNFTGVRNLGNTCYMNAVLQCLASTKQLAVYLLQKNFENEINRNNNLGHQGEVAMQFRMIVIQLWAGESQIMPFNFKDVFSRYNSSFEGYGQQDAHEFMACVLDNLHEDLNRVNKRTTVPEQNNDTISDREAAFGAWSVHEINNQSIIVYLFQGQYKSTVKCLTCSYESTTFDVFQYLSLPVLKRSCSVQDCLKEFGKPERMSGDCQWKCPRCKRPRDAEKRISIYRLPKILLIHLKRFEWCGRWRDKISTNVDFPTSNLDMSPYVIDKGSCRPFDLYGVTHHSGSVDQGHYIAYCKNSRDGSWLKYDDTVVSHANSSRVKTSGAYILFYAST